VKAAGFPYEAWHPTLEDDRQVLSVLLSPAAERRAPGGDRPFFEVLLTTLGMELPFIGWEIEPFLTGYFTETRQWDEAWEARLLLASTASIEPPPVRGVPVRTPPAQTRDPNGWISVRVLADFPSLDQAETCRAALKADQARPPAGSVHYERYELRRLARHEVQLMLTVLTVERERAQPALHAAAEATVTCRQHGGRTEASR
jgi:hypothetical protein